MVVAVRNVRADQKFAEVRNPKHGPESADRLFENLLPMGNEQKTRLPLLVIEEPLEIKRRHDGLSCPGRRHNKISPMLVNEALGFEGIENPFLKGMRAKVEKDRRNSLPRPGVFESLA
jgi:hypothetical protein